MYAKYIKRILDFILSLIALIVLSPVLLVVAILVRIKLGSPIIFKQQRPGKDEKIFTLYKFRTMTDKKDENGRKSYIGELKAFDADTITIDEIKFDRKNIAQLKTIYNWEN